MAKEYKVRPSEILYLDDPYVAFCFDEACYFILSQWDYTENKWKQKPKWKDDEKKSKPKSNKSFIEFVEKYS